MEASTPSNTSNPRSGAYRSRHRIETNKTDLCRVKSHAEGSPAGRAGSIMTLSNMFKIAATAISRIIGSARSNPGFWSRLTTGER